MRAVVQRVDSAAVEVEGAMVGSVGKGLLVLLGVEKEDKDRDLEYLLDKVDVYKRQVISWPAIMPSLWGCRWQSLSALPTAIMF